jgi:hypothetical protein
VWRLLLHGSSNIEMNKKLSVLAWLDAIAYRRVNRPFDYFVASLVHGVVGHVCNCTDGTCSSFNDVFWYLKATCFSTTCVQQYH